jgi:hypothetical protein
VRTGRLRIDAGTDADPDPVAGSSAA